MQCPLGLSAVSQSFGWAFTVVFALEEERIEAVKEEKRKAEKREGNG